MRIAVTGSTGLVGSAIVEYLSKQGHEISRLVRNPTQTHFKEKTIYWDIKKKEVDLAKLEGHDVVIHLAGASIASRRWSEAYKKEIYHSRVDGTKLLSTALGKLKNSPKILFSTSAVGYYGAHDAVVFLNEASAPGDDFLANVCKDWEMAAMPVQSFGTKVFYLRLGTVLSTQGGALAKMLPIFKLGLGGPLGNGQQMFSWIALDEIPKIIEFLIIKNAAAGAYNIVAPSPVSNAEFTRILGKTIGRPAFFPVPEFGIKLLFGEMGETLLLKGATVVPKRLLECGYSFEHSKLDSALKHALHY